MPVSEFLTKHQAHTERPLQIEEDHGWYSSVCGPCEAVWVGETHTEGVEYA